MESWPAVQQRTLSLLIFSCHVRTSMFYFGVNAGSSEIDSLGSPEPFCFGVNAGSSEIDSLGSISPAIEDDTVNIKTKATEV